MGNRNEKESSEIQVQKETTMCSKQLQIISQFYDAETAGELQLSYQ